MGKVLCLVKSKLPKAWVEQEVAIRVDEEDFDFIDDSVMSWVEREVAEKDDNYKQVIPYALVSNLDNEFACYPRNGTENRLHGLWSLGVGGHVDDEDKYDTFYSTCGACLIREMEEEFLDFDTVNSSFHLKGIINEEHSEVGKVHIGVVYSVDTLEDPSADEELEGLVWIKKGDIKNYNLELWSKLALKLL